LTTPTIVPLHWGDTIFGVTKEGFDALALEVFRFQYRHNPVYSSYVNAIGVNPEMVAEPAAIPFLPIRFFKSHEIKTGLFEPEAVFESSGTTGSVSSRHLIKDLLIYENSFLAGFEQFYGAVKDYCVIGLLPAYLEKKNSSLVYMVNKLIELSRHPQSGFYLYEYNKLAETLKQLELAGQQTLLIGVTFALLDFAEAHPMPLLHTTIMETGGMKGRKEEIIREELHTSLKKAFSLNYIHSEYGMTELLSQAYSKGRGVFHCPPWMKVLIRDEEDPFHVKNTGIGTINVIDLVNYWSCSFIATDDVGKLNPDGSFEVLGRVDGSDWRGCSLMVL
jgi:phenylacetate-coenzyme A ligase PaaK-like adenylate-forming protein